MGVRGLSGGPDRRNFRPAPPPAHLGHNPNPLSNLSDLGRNRLNHAESAKAGNHELGLNHPKSRLNAPNPRPDADGAIIGRSPRGRARCTSGCLPGQSSRTRRGRTAAAAADPSQAGLVRVEADAAWGGHGDGRAQSISKRSGRRRRGRPGSGRTGRPSGSDRASEVLLEPAGHRRPMLHQRSSPRLPQGILSRFSAQRARHPWQRHPHIADCSQDAQGAIIDRASCGRNRPGARAAGGGTARSARC